MQLPLSKREEEEIVAQGVQSCSTTELWLRVRVQFANPFHPLQLEVGYA